MSLMGKSRRVALHASRVASTEPRDLTGTPRDLHGLGLTNWHTTNMANKWTMFHHMINDEERGELHRMALTEMWKVSQQAGATGTMTSSPCCPSKTPWWGRKAAPRSWALQTWIEMAKYEIGTNAVLRSSAGPRKGDRYVLHCCEDGREQAVFK